MMYARLLPEPVPGREHVVATRPRDADGLALVTMELHRHADAVGSGLDAEDALALGVQRVVGHEILERFAGFEGRIELDQRFRPERAAGEDTVDVLLHPRVLDGDEAPHVVGVVPDQPVANRERIHSTTPMEA